MDVTGIKERVSYNIRFWAFVLGIVLITGVTLWVNNYSRLSVENISEESILNSKRIQTMFQDARDGFNQCNQLISGLLRDRKDVLDDRESLNVTEIEINGVLQEFMDGGIWVNGYLYYLDSSAYPNQYRGYRRLDGKQDQGMWENVFDAKAVQTKLEEEGGAYWEFGDDASSNRDEAVLWYFETVRQDGEPIGFLGMELDMRYLYDEMDSLAANANGRYTLLVSADGALLYRPSPDLVRSLTETEGDGEVYEGVIQQLTGKQGAGYTLERNDSDRYLYVYNRFPTGQTYITTLRIANELRQSNAMILFIAFIAIISVTFIHKNRKTNQTVLERVTKRIMRRFLGNLTPQKVKGQQAVIALHIGMAGAILTDAVYSIVLNKSRGVILEYFIYFGFVVSLIAMYTRSKQGLSPRKAIVVSILGMTLPVVEHITAGGFEAGRAGDGMLWLIVALYAALFILGEKKSIPIFNLFVLVLFIDLLLEVFWLEGYDYEKIFRFVNGFFFLGLACFVSMGIYVSNSEKDYEKEEALVGQLRANQSLLVQKEKMSTLGRLISGVANDINTPIGAMKASVETMEATFERLLWALMKAGQKWGESEYERLEQFIVLSLYSKAQMKSTKEVREAKKGLLRFMEEKGVEDADVVVESLVKLEIVDMDLVEQHASLFQKEKTNEILKTVVEMSSFLTGIPTTIHSAERVSNIIKALKSYVHSNEEGEDVEYDVVKSIDNVLVLYQSQLKPSIEIRTDYEEGLPALYGNPDEMAQVWSNLIQNAIDEMKEEGGRLTISVKRTGEEVEVGFSDTGAGIPEHIKDKIFSPFFTTKDGEVGNGLGLNIVKRIVDRYGGDVQVESGTGEGTRFIVRLPISR